jgi:hypothetical protein
MQGWKRYKDDPDPRIRQRFEWEMGRLKSGYTVCLWAMERRLRETNEAISLRVRALRREMEKEFGLFSRLASALAGPVLVWTSRREEKRLAAGKVYEPPTIIERRNWAVG